MELSKRQEEIVKVALTLAAEGGVANVTIKKLGEALGISEPAVYRHFASKAEIVKAMIRSFEFASDQTIAGIRQTGLEGLKAFIASRFSLAAKNPPLAKVMFAEELFMGEPEYAELILGMMHSHRDALRRMFREAVEAGELRNDIAPDMLFRIVFGPVRLLVKQWGMSGRAFDLEAAGTELWNSLEKLLQPTAK